MILTVEEVTREALKILEKSFHDTYTKQNRKQIGGNEYVHNVQREATTDSEATAAVK
jgi:hypothetical protein